MTDDFALHKHKIALIDAMKHAHERRLLPVLALTPEEAREVVVTGDGVPRWHHIELNSPVRCDSCDRERPWSPAVGWVESDGSWLCKTCGAPDEAGAGRMARLTAAAALSAALHQAIRAECWVNPGAEPHNLAVVCSMLRRERDALLHANGLKLDSWHEADRTVRGREERARAERHGREQSTDSS